MLPRLPQPCRSTCQSLVNAPHSLVVVAGGHEQALRLLGDAQVDVHLRNSGWGLEDVRGMLEMQLTAASHSWREEQAGQAEGRTSATVMTNNHCTACTARAHLGLQRVVHAWLAALERAAVRLQEHWVR